MALPDVKDSDGMFSRFGTILDNERQADGRIDN